MSRTSTASSRPGHRVRDGCTCAATGAPRSSRSPARGRRSCPGAPPAPRRTARSTGRPRGPSSASGSGASTPRWCLSGSIAARSTSSPSRHGPIPRRRTSPSSPRRSTARLAAAGIADLAEVVALAADAARAGGLVDPRITSDVKHVEIGLTDKSDSARFAASWLAERGITGALVLIGGDELGPIGGVAGQRLVDVGGRPRPRHGRVGRDRAGRRPRPGGAPGWRPGPFHGAARRATRTPSRAPGAPDRPRPGLGRRAAHRRTPRSESPRRSARSATASRRRGAPGRRTDPGPRPSSS